MASSSDNLMAAYGQPWAPQPYRPAFPDTWDFSDFFTKETDTVARALQTTFAPKDDGLFSPEMMTMLGFNKQTPNVSSGGGGSEENEASASVSISKPRARGAGPTGRVSKRKSRSSKRTMTTFFPADPASFRQMVQQITGVKGVAPQAHHGKVEAECGGTLDSTSAFLLDCGSTGMGTGTIPPPLPLVSHRVQQLLPEASGIELESFYSFPTLESWKAVM